jgi:hypothetical protein
MKKLPLITGILAFVLVAGLAHAAPTTEKLVLASAPVLMPQLEGRTAIEIQNLGPNPIWCAIASTPVVNKSRKIGTGEAWSPPIYWSIPIYCIASTGDQVTGAATIVSEAK